MPSILFMPFVSTINNEVEGFLRGILRIINTGCNDSLDIFVGSIICKIITMIIHYVLFAKYLRKIDEIIERHNRIELVLILYPAI